MLNTKLFGAKSADSLHVVLEKACDLAKSSNLVKRVSAKFCPKELLLTTLSLLGESSSTFHSLSKLHNRHSSREAPSPQALHARISSRPKAVEKFMKGCIDLALKSSLTPRSKQKSWKVNRVIIGDCSTVRLPKAFAEEFPATGNTHGRTAGVKLNLSFDLLNYEVIEADLITTQRDDKIIGESLLDHLRENDLAVRDMGFFKGLLFQQIEERGAFWMSRLPGSVQHVKIVQQSGKVTKLEDVLKSAEENELDLTARLYGGTLTTRLVAVRAAKSTVRQRIAELKDRYQKKGKTPPDRLLARAHWHLMVTNLTKEMMSISDLTELYAQRWSIEIAFRSWKQSSALENLFTRKSCRAHVMLFLLSGVLKCVLSLCAYSSLLVAHNHLVNRFSLQKISSFVSDYIEDIHRRKRPQEESIRLLLTEKRRAKDYPRSLTSRLLCLLS